MLYLCKSKELNYCHHIESLTLWNIVLTFGGVYLENDFGEHRVPKSLIVSIKNLQRIQCRGNTNMKYKYLLCISNYTNLSIPLDSNRHFYKYRKCLYSNNDNINNYNF